MIRQLLLLSLFTTFLVWGEIIKPFEVRFAANANGDVATIGNTLLTAPKELLVDGVPPTNLVNDKINMQYINIDKDFTTNSSRATLALQEHSKILFAGLYWGARSSANTAKKGTVKIKTPDESVHTLKTKSVYNAKKDDYYSATIDVTSLINEHKNGTYTVGDIQARTGNDSFGGWALVVVYENQNLPLRSMTLFDGYAFVPPNVTMKVQGFKSPSEGAFNAYLSAVVFEGDSDTVGDSLTLNGKAVADSLNDKDNFFNSKITHNGKHFTLKTPNYENQLGFDIKRVDITGLIKNGDTQATMGFTTNKDYYQPVALGFVTDYDTDLAHTQKLVQTPPFKHGQAVSFVSTITNNAKRDAFNLTFQNRFAKGLYFVPDSVTLNGKAVKASLKNNTISVPIKHLKANESIDIAFQSTIGFADEVPFGVALNNQATVLYEIKSLGMKIAAPSDANSSEATKSPTKITMEEPPKSLGLILRHKSMPKVLTRDQSYTFEASLFNPSKFAATHIEYIINAPKMMRYQPNSATLNGKAIKATIDKSRIVFNLDTIKPNTNGMLSFNLIVDDDKRILNEQSYDINKTLNYKVIGSSKRITEKSKLSVLIDEDPRYTKAKAHYASGEYFAAMKLFDTLYNEHIHSHELNVHLAHSAQKIREHEASIAAYERAHILRPQDSNTTLDFASLYIDMNLHAKAKVMLEDVNITTKAQQDRRQTLINAIENRRKRNSIIPIIQAGTGLDTNVNGSASSELLSGYYNDLLLNNAQNSNALNGRPSLYAKALATLVDTYDIGNEGAWYLQGKATFLNRHYITQNDFSLGYAKASLGLGYTHSSVKLFMPFEVDHIVFGGTHLLNSVGLAPKMTVKISDDLEAQAGATYQGKRYLQTQNSVRNSHNFIAHTHATYRFDKQTINAGYEIQKAIKTNTTNSASYINYWMHTLHTTYMRGFNYDIQGLFSLRYRNVSYADTITNSTQSRIDNVVMFYAQGTKELFENLFVNANYTGVVSLSNLAPIQYQKHALECSLQYQF